MTHSTCMKEAAQKHKSPIDAWRLRGSCVHHCGEVGFRCEVKLGQIVGMSVFNFNLILLRRTSHVRLLAGLGCACQKETATQGTRYSAGASDKAGPTLFRYRPKAQGRDRGTRLSVVRVYALAFPDNLHKPSFGSVEILGSEWFTLRTCKLKPTNDLERGPPQKGRQVSEMRTILN